jgi:hypothetical protein
VTGTEGAAQKRFLAPFSEALPRVLDPACGGGVFLSEAYSVLLQAVARGTRDQVLLGDRVTLARDCIFGVDCDSQALSATRRNLLELVLGREFTVEVTGENERYADELADALERNIRLGDALIGPDFHAEHDCNACPFDWRAAFPHVLNGSGGGFDAVVGNPPYVSIRLLTRERGPEIKAYLRGRYRCARGAYDLYVLFLERALELLRPGGMCGMIVPNKLLAQDYAQACRDMLARETTLHRIDDCSTERLFRGASVYPCIVVWEKTPPKRPGDGDRRFPLSFHAGTNGDLNVESRVDTIPLGECATLHSGTTGFTAQRMADALVEWDDVTACDNGRSPQQFQFIVSGNIDRYTIHNGSVRFMRRAFRRPVLPANSQIISVGKRILYAHRKIVISGMGRRLEAAWDDEGRALGVQVFAAVPMDFVSENMSEQRPLRAGSVSDGRTAHAQSASGRSVADASGSCRSSVADASGSCRFPLAYASGFDARYLLALLNSRLWSYLFARRFAAKRLGGGYFAVNKGQLVQLPVRVIDESKRRDCWARELLCRLVDRMHELQVAARSAASAEERRRIGRRVATTDRGIDRLVYGLYRLSTDEIARVEEHFRKWKECDAVRR